MIFSFWTLRDCPRRFVSINRKSTWSAASKLWVSRALLASAEIKRDSIDEVSSSLVSGGSPQWSIKSWWVMKIWLSRLTELIWIFLTIKSSWSTSCFSMNPSSYNAVKLFKLSSVLIKVSLRAFWFRLRTIPKWYAWETSLLASSRDFSKFSWALSVKTFEAKTPTI